MELIYQNEQNRFYLVFTEADKDHPARMQVIRESGDGSSVVLMDYTFPVQLIPEVHVAEKGSLAEKDLPEENKEDSASGEASSAAADSTDGGDSLAHGRAAEILTFSLHLEVHHVSGMVQGEFTEEEEYSVVHPFAPVPDPSEGTAEGESSSTEENSGSRQPKPGDASLQCYVVDIVRKTRFAAAPRHLEHVPKRTYPPVDGKQGPYGHPSIRTLPPIPRRKHTMEN